MTDGLDPLANGGQPPRQAPRLFQPAQEACAPAHRRRQGRAAGGCGPGSVTLGGFRHRGVQDADPPGGGEPTEADAALLQAKRAVEVRHGGRRGQRVEELDVDRIQQEVGAPHVLHHEVVLLDPGGERPHRCHQDVGSEHQVGATGPGRAGSGGEAGYGTVEQRRDLSPGQDARGWPPARA